ncbi:hypothetical protein RJ639_005236 [Escallonia herrerae]|uniref:Glabrous enhancer-binding protein-like DBD domain-containing protein n=1 Tax=Escallonia herrerae TaxID=1293975 RepID=A0AA88W3N6_9ASTE|nr:hypothetical protein RJ639_005236 [Escallonia herrerae]
MDSTPNPTACKLPIKRKSTDPASSSLPKPNPIPDSKLESPAAAVAVADDDDYYNAPGGDRKPPPFKFHRIWTEPDEIRFLRGLLGCSADGLSFPRDLGLFYARFSGRMSQPYTKSQLSEKLRRLRKKFRVISSRLAKGLDKALLSPHDRALYELSRQLWHPDNSSTSPFGVSNVKPPQKRSNLVGVNASFSPTLHSSDRTAMVEGHEIDDDDVGYCGNLDDGDVKLSEVNVELEEAAGEEKLPVPDRTGIGEVVGKVAIDVFDESLKEVRMEMVGRGLVDRDDRGAAPGGSTLLEVRWREQRVAEFDALGRRLRLVLEDSLQRQ